MVFRVSWRVGRGKFDPRGGHRLVNRKKIITRTEKLRRKNSYRRGLQVTSKSPVSGYRTPGSLGSGVPDPVADDWVRGNCRMIFFLIERR